MKKEKQKSRLLQRIIALLLSLALIFGVAGPVQVKAGAGSDKYIVLIVDASGQSRFLDSTRTVTLYTAASPLPEVKEAAKKFADALANLDGVKISIVAYGSSARLISDFTDDYTQVKSDINNLYQIGGRKNMGAALDMAYEQLSSITDPDAEKTVVLVSPGMTDEGQYLDTGHWNTSNASGSDWHNLTSGIHYYRYANYAWEQAEALKGLGTKIYTIGMTQNMENCPTEVKPPAQFFIDVLEALASDGCFYKVENIDDFVFIFDELAQDVIYGSTGKFRYAAVGESDDKKATYYFDHAYFDSSAEEYNPSLSTMSLCLAMAAFGANGASMEAKYYTDDQAKFDYSSGSYIWPDNSKTKELKYKNQWVNAESLLEDIGFEVIEANADYKTEPTPNSIGVIVGMKTVESDDGDYTLIALATRGGNYFSEWSGNFQMGASGNHYGFNTAKNTAKTFLNDFISRHSDEIKTPVKLWMAGYSRGGAVVNLLAGELTDAKKFGNYGEKELTRENIFAYCFEPPRGLSTSVCSREDAKKYKNIHNIVNPNDIVPLVAMNNWDFIRYGVDEEVIPDSEYTSKYNRQASKMMSYYTKFDYDAIKDSYVSVSEYEAQFDVVVDRVKTKAKSKYDSYSAAYERCFNSPANNGFMEPCPSFEKFWNEIYLSFVCHEKKYEGKFSVDFTEIEGYGIYDNAYEYYKGLIQIRRHSNLINGPIYDAKISDYVSLIDLFAMHKLPKTINTWKGLFAAKDENDKIEYEQTNMGQNNKDVIYGVSGKLGSRSTYNTEVETGLSKLLELVMSKSSPITIDKSGLFDAIGGKARIYKLGISLAMFDNIDSSVDAIYKKVIKYYKDQGLDVDAILTPTQRDVFKKGLKKLIQAVIDYAKKQDGTDAVYSLYQNAGLIKMAHYPELCLAWLQSQDENYSSNNNRVYYPSKKRVIRINCPVDVKVYDSNNNLVAEIKDNVPQDIYGSSISCSYTEDGEKVICLPLDEEYNVKIEATDAGKLNISVNITDKEDVCSYIENYYDISINKGDKISVNLPKDFNVDENGVITEKITGLHVSDDNGVISASEILKDENADNAVYQIEANTDSENGGVITGGGEYILGSFAKVCASEYEDCSFCGWYENDELVSMDRNYRFLVTSDRILTAKFEGETQYGHNGAFTAQIIAEEGGIVVGNTDFTALDGYPVEIMALPVNGYDFVSWETDGNCIIEDANEEITNIKLVDENVTVYAKFKKDENYEQHQDHQDQTEENDEYIIVADGYSVRYETETSWQGGYNGKITITNNTGKDLDEWMLRFNMSNKIINIWNAQILESDDSKYSIKDATWNRKIAPGSSVTFGFTVSGEQVVEPSNIALYVKKQVNDFEKCNIEFVKTNEWNGGCIGEIVIHNNSDKPIKNWSLEFTCDGNINGLWNGNITFSNGNKYKVTDAGYNYIIEPNSTIKIGVNLAFNDSNSIPNAFVLNVKE